MPWLTRVSLVLQHAFPLMLLLPSQQAWAFVVAPLPLRALVKPTAPHIPVCRTRYATAGVHCATAEDAVRSVALTAEEWDGFGEEDHDRFLAEFWQKKPLLIRQAVKG